MPWILLFDDPAVGDITLTQRGNQPLAAEGRVTSRPIGIREASGKRTIVIYHSAFTFDAAGNQQIDQAPEGTTTRTWNYENQETLVVCPDGQRVTMAYNADYRQFWRE